MQVFKYHCLLDCIWNYIRNMSGRKTLFENGVRGMEVSSRSSEPLDPVWLLVAFGRGGVKLEVLLLFLLPFTLGELRGGLGKHGHTVHREPAVNRLCADSNAGLGCL